MKYLIAACLVIITMATSVVAVKMAFGEDALRGSIPSSWGWPKEVSGEAKLVSATIYPLANGRFALAMVFQEPSGVIKAFWLRTKSGANMLGGGPYPPDVYETWTLTPPK